MKFNRILGGALAATLLLVTGCTDAQRAKQAALGDPARVICFSGGRLTFDDFSTGKVENEEHSDGFYFVARSTNRLVSVSGDCNLDYGAEVPANYRPVHAANVSAALQAAPQG